MTCGVSTWGMWQVPRFSRLICSNFYRQRRRRRKGISSEMSVSCPLYFRVIAIHWSHESHLLLFFETEGLKNLSPRTDPSKDLHRRVSKVVIQSSRTQTRERYGANNNNNINKKRGFTSKRKILPDSTSSLLTFHKHEWDICRGGEGDGLVPLYREVTSYRRPHEAQVPDRGWYF